MFEGVRDTPGAQAAAIIVDSNGGGNYTKIQDAIDAANPGDTIYVWAGTYVENFIINKTLTMIGNGTSNTTLVGAMDGNVVLIEADWVNFSGFEIKSSGSWNYGIRLNFANNCSVDSVKFTNLSVSVNLILSDRNTITNITGSTGSVNHILTFNSNYNLFKNHTYFSTVYSRVKLDSSVFNTLMDLELDNTPGTDMQNTIELGKCRSMTLKNNKITRGGVLITSFNSVVSHWNTHDIDQTNLVNGKPVYYLKDQQNTVIPSGKGQIILANCKDITVEDYDFNNVSSGITLGYSQNIVISDNTFTNNNYGVYIFESDLNTINNNNFNVNEYNIHLIGSNNTVMDNSLSKSDWNNIWLKGSDNRVINNTIQEGFNSIRLDWDSNRNLVYDNTCFLASMEAIGIYGKYNIIANNSCDLSPTGILLRDIENTVINNTCSNNHYGIKLGTLSTLKRPGSNIVKNNTCKNNDGTGIEVYTSDNLIENNYCSENAFGMKFTTSDNNIVRENNITYNINGFSLTSDCINNTIYHNNIIYNDLQVTDDGDTEWSFDSEGNYWSDYKGSDDGSNGRVAGDGIGDTEIPHIQLDNFPFVEESGWAYPGVLEFLDPGEVDPDGEYTLAWTASYRATKYLVEEDVVITFDSANVVYYGSDLSFDIVNKDNGTYYYRVIPYNDLGPGSWSNFVGITVDWLPNIPKNLSVAVFPAGNTLNISWDPNKIDTQRYKLEFTNETMTIRQTLEIFDHPDNTYNHTGLNDDEFHLYWLSACDGRGQWSERTESVFAIPHDSVAPAPPTGLKVLLTSNDTVVLTWNSSLEGDVVGYNIYRSTLSSDPATWGRLIAVVPGNKKQYFDSDADLLEDFTYYYTIRAYDEVPNYSNFSNIVTAKTLLGPHAPEINHSLPDFELLEDTIDVTSINLSYWFKDINGDPLKFSYEGQEHIFIDIDGEDGSVLIAPEENWSGQETLTFTASDGLSSVSDDVTITVLPVNDPPGDLKIMQPFEGDEVYDDEPISFLAACDDPDEPYGDLLTFNWTSNISGHLGYGDYLEGLYLSPGVHLITLTVWDTEGQSINTSINITVLASQAIDPPDKPNKGDEDKDSYIVYSQIVISAVVSIIIIIILGAFLFMFYRRKKVKVKDAPTEPQPQPFYTVQDRMGVQQQPQPMVRESAPTHIPIQTQPQIVQSTTMAQQPTIQRSPSIATVPQPKIASVGTLPEKQRMPAGEKRPILPPGNGNEEMVKSHGVESPGSSESKNVSQELVVKETTNPNNQIIKNGL